MSRENMTTNLAYWEKFIHIFWKSKRFCCKGNIGSLWSIYLRDCDHGDEQIFPNELERQSNLQTASKIEIDEQNPRFLMACSINHI